MVNEKRIWQAFLILIFATNICRAGPAPNQDRDIRQLVVKVVVDEECNLKRKKIFLTKILGKVSEAYQKEFDICFSINGWSKWKSNDSVRSINQLAPSFFKQVGKEETDIVIGFTFQKGLGGRYAVAYNKEGYVLARALKDRSLLIRVLKHEIAHLFGATHINDRESLMDRFIRGNKFKKTNSAIIKLQRTKDFTGMDAPPPRENWPQLIKLYKKIVIANEMLENHQYRLARRTLLRRWLLNENSSPQQLAEVQKAYVNLEKVYIYLSFIYMEMRNFNQVIAECQKAIRINPKFYEAYNLIGIAHRKSGRTDQALQYYQEALKINNTPSKVYFNLGIAYKEKGDQEQAATAYKQAIKLNPNFANAWNNLGCLYLDNGNHRKAIKIFSDALARGISYQLLHSNYAHALLLEGNLQEARLQVNRALSLIPRLPGPHNVLGMIYSRQKHYQKAIKEFNQALSLDPKYYKSLNNLGNLYLRKGDYQEALEMFHRCARVNPKFAGAYTGLGDTYLIMKTFDKAKEAYLKSLKFGPHRGKVHNNLAIIFYYLGEYRKSSHHLTKAEKLGIGVNKIFKEELERHL